MKPLHKSLAALSAIGFALITASTAWSLRSSLRVDAPTPEGKVTQLTTELLEQAQFSHVRLDDALAAKFLDSYIDSLDGTREILFQSDTDEFHRAFPHLAEAMRTQGETQPAHLVFTRFLKRVEQREKFVTQLLTTEKFDFTGQDRFTLDRDQATRPRDAAEAEALWREQLRAEYLQEKLGGKTPEQIVPALKRRYESQAKTIKNYSPDTVLQTYLNALAHVYDPHSDYMDHEELDSFETSLRLSFAGIGATLQEEDGYCKIRELVPGGPAAMSGKLKIGDRIVGVSQDHGKDTTDLVDMPLPQAVGLIRGPKGTDVTLTILPALANAGTRKTVTIQRDVIRLEEERAKARIIDFPTGGGQTMRLGVIDLPAFYASEDGNGPSATADVTKLIKKLKKEGARGLVLDLRRNGGGSLQEAITLTGLFIPSGPVVQTRDLSGHIDLGDDRHSKTLYKDPLIVLTSRLTASASEILAGALQDYGRAVIVGDTCTFGKGTVQTMLSLGPIMKKAGATPATDPGALKVTISKFYRPSGNSTQLRGVAADIVLPSITDRPEIGESGMKNPLPWDTIPAASFERSTLVKPYVADLRKSSEARVAADPEFTWLKEDLERVKQSGDDKSVSMNEAARRQEKEEAKARTKARAAKLTTQKVPAATAYEITVKNAAANGLPAPMDPKKAQAVPEESKDEDADADASLPSNDFELREAQHILADYIRLVNPGPPPVVTQR